MSTQSIVYQVGARLTCKIDKFSALTEKFYSDTFCAGGYKWRILIYPKGNSVECLSMYLDVANSESLPYGWNIPTVFSLSVIDQNNSDGSVKKDTEHQFKAEESDWGFTSFISLVELHKSDGGYLVNDQCIIEADLRILNSGKSDGEGSSEHNMAKINIGGEDIELSNAEINKRAKVVISDLPAKASETLYVHLDVSLNADPKSSSTSSSLSSGLLMQAIVRQETLMDIIINVKDENCKLKMDLEVCQHQLNNAKAEVSRLKKEAEHLRIRFKKEQEEKEQKRNEKAEAHLYTIIKVARDSDLFEQIGKDIYFDLVDHDKVHSFRIKKQTPFTIFKEEVSKKFGIPVQVQRFWLWAKRQNNTYRPIRPLKPMEEAQSVGQLREVSNKTNNAELKLFLEVELGLDLQPVAPPEKTKEEFLLFFKFYDPLKEELRYVGRLFVKGIGKPIEILTKLNEMAGFGHDQEIELFEEIKFEPNVMCERIDEKLSFSVSQLGNGDIICFQRSLAGVCGQYRYPEVSSFLKYVHKHQVQKPDGGYVVRDQYIIEADLRILNSSKSDGERSSQHNMAKINIGGEDIELSKAEIKERARVVISDLPAKASEALHVHPDVSLNTDPKLALTSSSSSSGLLMQAIARQETLIDIIINMKDENRQLKTDFEVCQRQLNNAEAEVSRLKKEVEQSAKKLVEIQDVKKSSIDAKLEGLEEALTEEKKTIEGLTAVELKERCLNMYSAGYMACEKDMKSILEEKGFHGLLTDSDNEASSELTEEKKE